MWFWCGLCGVHCPPNCNFTLPQQWKHLQNRARSVLVRVYMHQKELNVDSCVQFTRQEVCLTGGINHEAIFRQAKDTMSLCVGEPVTWKAIQFCSGFKLMLMPEKYCHRNQCRFRWRSNIKVGLLSREVWVLQCNPTHWRYRYKPFHFFPKWNWVGVKRTKKQFIKLVVAHGKKFLMNPLVTRQGPTWFSAGANVVVLNPSEHHAGSVSRYDSIFFDSEP